MGEYRSSAEFVVAWDEKYGEAEKSGLEKFGVWFVAGIKQFVWKVRVAG